MAKIILFGGTFDPIHHGHLITARAALEFLNADALYFIPAAISPHKLSAGPHASPPQRLEMLRVAIAGEPRFQIDDLELARPGPSYTIDTITALQARVPDARLTLLLGADQLPKLHTWHRVTELLDRIDIAILPRPGQTIDTGLAEISRHLGPAVAARFAAAVLPAPQIDISATDIRARAGRGQSIRYLVPDAVADYIAANHLYA